MGDEPTTTAPAETKRRASTKAADKPEHTPESFLSATPRNPKGESVTIHIALDPNDPAVAFKALEHALDELFLAHDVTLVWLATLNPAVASSLARGDSAKEALGWDDEPSDLAKDTYEAYKGRSSSTSSGGGRSSGGRSGGGGRAGGGGGRKPFDTDSMPDDDYNALPQSFRDALDNFGCPSCGEHKFWDNRNEDRGGPKIACANKECEGGGEKRDGGYFPWGWFGGDSGGGRSRRSRGD